MSAKHVQLLVFAGLAVVATVLIAEVIASCTYPCHCVPCDASLDGDADGDGDGDSDADGPVDGDVEVDGDAEVVGQPDAVIDMANDYVTLAPGGSYSFESTVDCPEDYAPCTVLWDFGTGETSDEEDPGAVTFPTAGFFLVTLTATNSEGVDDPTPAVAHVAVWTGEFTDNFGRTEIDWDADGWRPPIIPEALYSIEAGRLRVEHDLAVPGSSAIMTWISAQDVHVEATQSRWTDGSGEHFTDVILRMHPTLRNGSYYRVRVWEAPTSESDSLEIAIFKISDPLNEHGTLLNDPSPMVASYPRDHNIRVIVDLVGAEFHVTLEDPAAPGVPVLEATATDTAGPPYLYAGQAGLAHFVGLTFFDDFVLRELP